MGERLTKRNADGRISVEGMTAALGKLAVWEDMQEQWRLVELPCKVGERVYELFRTNNFQKFHNCMCLCSGMINGHKVMEPCAYYDSKADSCNGAFDENREWNIRCVPFEFKHMRDIMKSGYIFITREEAEAAMKEEMKAEAALKAMEAQDGA